MPSPLAISMRPKNFDEMIGVDNVVRKIRKRINKGRSPKAWLFSGQTGAGKTTLARIIAVSLQCKHGDFGNPCTRCLRDAKEFDITELNMPDIGVKELREILDGSYYNPNAGSLNRVYILDEMHTMSKPAQNLMLKFTEDCPDTTKWLGCTTEPQRIIRTLRRRFAKYELPSLGLDDVRRLVRRGLKRLRCDYDSTELTERLLERNVTSPALVVNAVEDYAAGASAEEAANVELGSNIDVQSLTRAIYTGSWEAATRYLMDANPEDIPLIRSAISRYLNSILLGEPTFSSKTDVVADAILRLQGSSDDLPSTTAALYKVCKYFNRGKK